MQTPLMTSPAWASMMTSSPAPPSTLPASAVHSAELSAPSARGPASRPWSATQEAEYGQKPQQALQAGSLNCSTHDGCPLLDPWPIPATSPTWDEYTRADDQRHGARVYAAGLVLRYQSNDVRWCGLVWFGDRQLYLPLYGRTDWSWDYRPSRWRSPYPRWCADPRRARSVSLGLLLKQAQDQSPTARPLGSL